MAFTHGKNAVVAIRDVTNHWQDLTSATSEVTVPGKAGVAETTVFGKGAKTYIGGLLEGTVTMKGYWDSAAETGGLGGNYSNILAPDVIFAGLLGSQPTTGLTVVAQVTAQSNYGQFVFFPQGPTAGVGMIADIVMTDYQTSAPVNGVVAYNATFQLSGATAATASLNGGTTTGAYGLQVIRAASTVILNTAWIAAAGGKGSYAALMGTTV